MRDTKPPSRSYAQFEAFLDKETIGSQACTGSEKNEILSLKHQFCQQRSSFKYEEAESFIISDGNERMPISEQKTVKTLAVHNTDDKGSNERLLTRIDGASQIEDYDTIPMMVLKNISSREGEVVPVMHSEISGAAGGAAVVGLGNILGSVLKFGSNYLLQVGFGATLYGLYSICLSMVILASSLCNLGLSDTTVRYTAIYRSKGQAGALNGLLVFCTSISSITGIIGGSCVLLFSLLFAKIKHEPALSPIMQLMAPMVPLLCVQAVWFSMLQGLKLFKWRVLSERILTPLVLLILALCFFFLSPNIFNITIATIVSTLVGAGASVYILYRILAPDMKKSSKTYDIQEWVSFATFNFLTSITEVILESIDTLLLVLFAVTDLQIGRYSAAVKISDFISMPLFSLNTMFAPTIAELYSQGEKRKLGTMYQVVNKWIVTLSLPIFFVALLFAKSLLQLSGTSFVEAWPLLIVSAVGSIVNAGTGSVGYMLLMTGHQKVSFFNSLTSVILNIILGLLLIPSFGAMGTALGTAITLILMNIVRIIEIRLLLNLYPYNWDILKPLGAGCLSALLLESSFQLFDDISLIIHLSFIFVFIFLYIGFLFLFSVSSEDAIVLDALKKKFFKRGYM